MTCRKRCKSLASFDLQLGLAALALTGEFEAYLNLQQKPKRVIYSTKERERAGLQRTAPPNYFATPVPLSLGLSLLYLFVDFS